LTSYEVMKMKAVNHEPVISPEGTLAFQGGEEVSKTGDGMGIHGKNFEREFERGHHQGNEAQGCQSTVQPCL